MQVVIKKCFLLNPEKNLAQKFNSGSNKKAFSSKSWKKKWCRSILPF